MDLQDVLFLIGPFLVALGVGMIFIPAGVITLGVLAVGVAFAMGKRPRAQVKPNG